MAKKSDKTESPVTNPAPVAPDEKGWENISVSGPQNWHVCRVGNRVQGLLLGRYFRKGNADIKAKYFYQIKVNAPTAVMRKEDIDEPAVERIAEPGEIVCVDERKDLEDLAMLCDDGGKYAVRLTPSEKVSIGGAHTFWRWEKQKRVLSPPTRNPRPIQSIPAVAPSREPGDDSDMPF